MSTPHELEQLRLRLGRMERELGEARRDLAALERRAAVEDYLAERPEVAEAAATMEVKTAVETEAVPPPLPVEEPVAAEKKTWRALEPEAQPVRDWLRRAQLWPPAEAGEGEGTEARLGAWWATRAGVLLAVVGVVFFGVYVSLRTPPWVRFAELVGIALGVVAAGRWLERRAAGVGAAIYAGGLALVYFTIYAGHAVAAVRVFESLAAGVAAQGAAVAVILAAAWRRGSAGVATMAVGLGGVTALVSGGGGLDGYALGSAVALAAVAVALKRAREWEGPAVAALAVGYATYAAGLGGAMSEAARWAGLVALATIFFLRDARRVERAAGRAEMVFQNANSSAALGLGVVTALAVARERMEFFYLGAAAWCGVAAWLRGRWAGRGDATAAVLTAKAVGALTLAVIEVADARTTALALLVQAWALAWAARRAGSGVMAAGSAMVAMVAVLFFAWHGPVAGGAPWSAEGLGAVGFALGLAALAAVGVRWLVADWALGRVLEGAGVAAAALALMHTAAGWEPGAWTPGWWMAGAALFAGMGWALRAGAIGWAAAGLAGLANVGLWREATGGGNEVVGNALCVLGPTLALVGVRWLGGRVRAVALAVGLVGGCVVGFALAPVALAWVGAALLAGGLMLGAARGSALGLAWQAGLVALVATVRWLALRGGDVTAVELVGVGIIWALPLGRRWAQAREAGVGGALLEHGLVWLGVVAGLAAVVEAGSGTAGMAGLVVLTAANGLAAWPGGVGAARPTMPVLGGMTFVIALMMTAEDGAGWAVLVAGVVLAALPLRGGPGAERWTGKTARVAGAVGAAALLFTLAETRAGALAAYATLGWGATAVGLFMLGLGRRALSYRIVGLLALGLCVGRVFFVDLQSATQRIAACLALGLIFIWVGFSYHRFRHLLAPEKPRDQS